MNYRHAFHAGNFADVLKHSILALCLLYLRNKTQPFRVIDTHAGIGLYDLAGDEALRTGEWREGIGLIENEVFEPEVAALLAPYLDTVKRVRQMEGPQAYPGSPLIAQHALRPDDRLILNEKHPSDQILLEQAVGRDRRIKVLALDGYIALKAHVPPPERRGLVLIDPPFEDKREFDSLLHGFAKAYAKWPTGNYLIWYPLKNKDQTDAFVTAMQDLALPRLLCVELAVRGFSGGGPLYGSGLMIVNPPFVLGAQMRLLLPALERVLAQGSGHFWRCDWLGITKE
jgi:23S rRNA (adenine2030-N6)-methyltransferase